MVCKYCHVNGQHHPRCPLYIAPKAKYYCFICGQGIYDGDEYIVNDCGEYCHYDCFHNTRDLLKWLGYEIQTMYEDD